MTKTPINSTLPRRNGISAIITVFLALAICLTWAANPAAAQLAGQGSLQGTVADSTGAVVPNATITATNVATNVSTVQMSSSAGFFNISPLVPGTYTVQVVATGFKTLLQSNVVVDALQTRVFNPALTVGAEAQTVTVTGAPPVLDTADASTGLIVENETYSNLPLQMNGNQRDPTAFGTLTPGAQTANNGGRLPIVGGTGSYLGQLYVDGMPAETVSQQGDNRLVSLTVSVDAVDQFQLVTSTPPAMYMGAGAENFTMKSGGLQYHGQVSDFMRNTVFDSWSFTNKWATVKNSAGLTVPAPKPPEHQNEFSVSGGGVVPHTGKKLFFFVAYDKYHDRAGVNPSLYTIPSPLMMAGDFTELNGNVGGGGQSGTGSTNPAILYDPTTNTCGTTCSRTPFQGAKNGVATNNVIPTAEISPIAKALQSFMPAPTNPAVLANNYLGSYPKGFDNHLTDYRVDYDLSAKQRISTLGTIGVQNYLNNYSTPYLPPPYIGGDLAAIYPKNFIVEDAYTISPNLVNQLKYGFTRFFQNIHNGTQGVANYSPTKLGITNLPQGQAGQEFPGVAFGTTAAYGTANIQTTWTTNSNSASTQLTTPSNFALTDNVQWLKGKHSFTFGITYQWQEINNANPATYTGVLGLGFNAFSTANFSGTSLSTGTAAAPSGYSYASFLLGAVAGSTSNATSAPSLGLQPLSETGGRYHPVAPYFQDSYKITPKLTLDLGLRWDYLPPFHEVKDRWTFLNPNLTNPLTNSLGMLQFAGSYGGFPTSCNCRTPVHTYWKNWGPRVGLAYSINDKTVIRAGYAQVFTQAGGVGGRGGAANGTGGTGFNVSAIGPTETSSTVTAGPSYWLNNSTAFTTLGLANTGLFNSPSGAAFSYPAAPTPGVAAQELNTGFYANSSNKFVSASSVSFPDPYLSSRAPELEMFNFGIERSITQDMTLAVNYVGNESHFIVNSGTTGSNARGYWVNQLNPVYLATLGPMLDSKSATPLLNAPATAANVAIVAKAMPSAPTPAFIQAAAALNSSATIAQMLVAFPQYSTVSDTWGNVGNFAYHALQITLVQRMSHGLTFNANYTFSKNIGDDGTYRSGFDIPAAAISRGSSAFKQDRIDRSWTAISTPQILNVFGVYKLPFGRGAIGSNSALVRWLAGGWQISGIYKHLSGTPMAVTWSGCSGSTYPGQGQCMPDINTSSTTPVRNQYKYGSGPNGYQFANLGSVQYVSNTAFQAPVSVSTAPGCTPPASCSLAQYLIGNSPRTAPLGLRNPASWNLDTGVRRAFPLHWEGAEFVFEADCLNTWNNVVFSGPSAAWSAGSTAFGTIGGISNSPRDYQFGGHINF